jgi:hypothetical protein
VDDTIGLQIGAWGVQPAWEDGAMADGSAAPLSGVSEHRWELRKEALTMALYVAICLMASLIVIPESAVGQTQVVGIIWGVTLGLALAHWFAFRVSARMVGAGTVRSSDVELIFAQLFGAGGVALLVSFGVLLLPDSVELQGAEYPLAALISLIGFGVARGAGATLLRAVVYALFVLAAAVTIAVLKNLLAGH